jgi:IS4 transposase
MTTPEGKRFRALACARRLRVGKVAGWRVRLLDPGGEPIDGRVVVTKLPAPLAAKAERRAVNTSSKKGRHLDPRSLQAAHFVMVFTTLPRVLLSDVAVLELYRYRWQIELAFKRLKQLLKLGRLPHQDAVAAKSWIHAKLLVALLLETLFRSARVFSPWGYDIRAATRSKAAAQLA